MSTRSTTHFMYHNKAAAIVYRHSDGYPEGAGTDILKFLKQVKKEVRDNRFGDPCYLSAKCIVFLADIFNDHYDVKSGKEVRNKSKLDFISVGAVLEDPGDIEYRYEIHCDSFDENGIPEVKCFHLGQKCYVPIPKQKTKKK